MSRIVKALVASAVCTVGAAGPAAAQTPPTAPTLKAALPCFSEATDAEVTGEGWTPGGQVRLRGRYVSGGAGEALDVTVTADAQGRIVFASRVPNDSGRVRGVEMTAEDLTRTAAGAPPEQRTATTRFSLSWFGVFYRPWNTDGPARGRPGRVRTIEAAGWLGSTRRSDTLYAHYYRLGTGRFRTVRVGRLTGPCGTLKRRFREFAFRPVPRGTYRVFFDTEPFTSDTTFDAVSYLRVRVR